MSFEVQQPLLALDSTAKARKRSIGAYDPVTGNNDGNGIAAIRESHRPRPIGIVQALGELTVTARFTEGDLGQLAPDALLKFGALHAQGQVEFAPLAGEIFG